VPLARLQIAVYALSGFLCAHRVIATSYSD
jgi:hypothetical protein